MFEYGDGQTVQRALLCRDCDGDITSKFLFDGLVFDQEYFGQRMAEALEAILMIEKTFGTPLREYAIRISRERYEARREAIREGFRETTDASRQ